jgi:phosphatidylglycerophosphatase A
MEHPQDHTPNAKPDPRLTLHFIATGFGSGLIPKAPGTWGSLAALPFGLAMLALPTHWMAMIILISTIAGIWVCDQVCKDLGVVEDHQAIVWDEFVGMWLAMMFIPSQHQLIWTLVAFAAFRFFDILKPGPIGVIDRKLKGGMGIMLDDVAAGFAALIVVQCLIYVFA